MIELFGPRFSPDLELTTLEAGLGIRGIERHYSGWDGLIRYLADWFEPFSEEAEAAARGVS